MESMTSGVLIWWTCSGLVESSAERRCKILILLNVVDVFSIFAWSVSIKDKTGKSITEAFKLIVKTSNCYRKPEKLRRR